MKAVTFRQPSATLIIAGAKPYNIARWRPARELVGQRHALHAGRTPPSRQEISDLLFRLQRRDLSFIAGGNAKLAWDILDGCLYGAKTLPVGAVLGTFILGEPRQAGHVFDPGFGRDKLDPEMWAWPILEPEVFPEPIPARGQLEFWDWNETPMPVGEAREPRRDFA